MTTIATTASVAAARPRAFSLWIYASIAVVASIFAFLTQAHFADQPMTIDEAMYFAVAMSHSLPYVDVLDQKPPLIYAWYKLALWIGGGGEDSVVVLR
ncbi:MAG TPA: hypothetical protein VFX19_10710, partial [Dehalococcoidia bacterium]|nr:hypothetical protein [Dehalococcoidia bacterium]